LFTRQAKTFLHVARCGGQPACDLATGLHTLQINRAILASVRSGAWELVGEREAS
jgi:hypothetical protein